MNTFGYLLKNQVAKRITSKGHLEVSLAHISPQRLQYHAIIVNKCRAYDAF